MESEVGMASVATVASVVGVVSVVSVVSVVGAVSSECGECGRCGKYGIGQAARAPALSCLVRWPPRPPYARRTHAAHLHHRLCPRPDEHAHASE
eukprot:1519326-Prymnesium_polylepis.1